MKITSLEYRYNNFDKKADISDKEVTKIKRWIDISIIHATTLLLKFLTIQMQLLAITN